MWSYHGDPSPEDTAVETYLRKYIRHPDIPHMISRHLSLYNHFTRHVPRSSDEIRKTVFMDKAGIIPFFSEDVASRLIKLWDIVHDRHKYVDYIKHRVKRLRTGGSYTEDPEVAIEQFTDWVLGMITPKEGTLGDITQRIISILTAPQALLKMVEDNPYIGGPVLKASIDVFQDVAPKLIFNIEEIVETIAAPLAPFGVGFLIAAVGLVIPTILGFMTFGLSLAEGKKSAAFLNAIQLVPLLGPFVRKIILDSVGVYVKVNKQRETLGKLPFIGPYIYTEPPVQENNTDGARATGGRTRRRRAHRRSTSLGRARRRGAKTQRSYARDS